MGSKIIGILAFVVVLGILVFIFQSGVLGKLLSLGDLSLKNPFTLLPPTSFQPPSLQPSPPAPAVPASQNVESEQSSAVSQNIPEGFTADQLSPYFGKVRIGSVSPGSQFSYGRLSINANLGKEESVNVTGWFLQANRGSQFLPRAINVYDPTGLTPESDVFLRRSETLVLYTTQSAIGKNLRLNKCIGYLENTNKFTPSLPRNCPSVGFSEISSFTGKCQDYIRTLGSCRLPAPNPDVPETDYACRSYIDTINYRGCYERHRGDGDFLSREWRVWTGSRFLDERHDRVLLLDKQGLLVDIYSY